MEGMSRFVLCEMMCTASKFLELTLLSTRTCYLGLLVFLNIISNPNSKPVMDLLVTLCAGYHLNPSDYTVEVLSTNKNNISFKPNSPIGSLEAEKIVLKPKGVEEKISRPYMPEVSLTFSLNPVLLICFNLNTFKVWPT